MNGKLVKSWCAYVVFVATFVFTVEFYHRRHKDASTAFKCRILVSKDLIVDESEKKAVEPPKKTASADSDSLYEKTKYGLLPKISVNGETVFDRYSTKTDAARIVKLAVALDKENIDDVIKLLSKLGSNKISFIVPTYMENFKSIVSVILEHGHEIFLLLPTQGSVSDTQNVAPFLANSNPEETTDKLLKLIASSTKVIGIANISSTLLMQSAQDMEVIALELAKRGLAFFDVNLQSDILNMLVQKTGLIYRHVTELYSPDKQQVPKENETYFVRFPDVNTFMQAVPEGVAFAPISQGKSK